MTRRLRTILIVGATSALLGVGIGVGVRLARGIRVGTAVVSQTLCSGVFVSGLDPDLLYVEAIRPIPGQMRLAKRLRYTVDRAAGQVTTRWAGAFESRAVYRHGFGCMLVHGDAGKDAVIVQPPAAALRVPPAAAPLEVQPPSPQLEGALDRAFAEPSEPPFRRVKAVVILHHGRIVAERYAPGYGADTPILGYSLAKSVTNALLGILVNKKKLSVDEPAPVPEWQDPSDHRREITIDQLLRMTSGLALAESDTGFDPVSRMLFLESDMAGYAARARLQANPGTSWEYTSGNTLILSRIIRDEVGGHAPDVVRFAQDELFAPLGITTATVEFDPTGTPVGCTSVLASARDWARFAGLYLSDGVARQRRILPPGWVDYSAAPTLDTDYGAGFWTNRGAHGNAKARIRAGMPEDAFYGSGNLGQRIAIIPSADLVVVRLGLTHSPDFDIQGFLRLIADTSAAIKSQAVRHPSQSRIGE